MSNKHLLSLVFFTFLFFLFTSCGVLLDDAKFRGVWHLTEANFYQYSEEFNSYLKVTGIEDLSPDTEAPIMSSFFGVKASGIVMRINTNKTWTVGTSTSEPNTIITDGDPGKWEIDTYNNTVTLTCPKGDQDTTVDQLWKDSNTVTNAWPMTTNNKFDFYIKASDFGRPYFEFEIAEKPVPDRIEKQRLEDYLSDKVDLKFNNDDITFSEFCFKWYVLDKNGEYYYLTNSISSDDKMKLYKILSITGEDAYKDRTKFESKMTTKRFYAMEGIFKRDGYQDK